jgi:CNT family concentrative nucleoside transporter
MPDYSQFHGTIAQRLQCLLGFAVFIALAWGIGRGRGRGAAAAPFPWRTLAWGVALQFAFALIVLRTPQVLAAITSAIQALLDFTRDGAKVVFGNLASPAGAPVKVSGPDGSVLSGVAENGAYFAFFVLPTIIFFSALTAVAYHSGVMQYVVQGLAWLMSRTMKTSGAETLSAAANIFVGQTEAPLMVRPFVAAATRSELACIMVAGFANIASGVLALYAEWLKDIVPAAAGHLAAACFISAPAALLVSKMMVRETEVPQTAGGVEFKVHRTDANLVDAAARGTSEGLALALNVGAMLIAFTALIAMVNGLLGWVFMKLGGQTPMTLQRLLSYPMAPVAWLAGVSWADAPKVGSLLGIKTVLNELIAYQQMDAAFAADPRHLSPRSALLATYALCGFANFASIGIQVGGISALAPERRADLSRLGLLAMAGGAIASLMTACVVGVLV